MRRTIFSIMLAIAVSIFGSWFILGGGTTKVHTVTANSFDNLSGWAWSGYTDADGNLVGVGWISFNCTTDPGCTNDYGVRIDETNRASGGVGNFSGYAWSSNIGWISFNAGETASCGGGAQINWTTGAVTGWAKALAASGSGNWDGCIKLSDSGPPAYGVTLGGTNFSGYAWGGNEVVGWMDWNPAGGGVKFTQLITECNDGVNNNDGDTLVDLDDPGCLDPLDNDESNPPLPECSDRIDNDNDGTCDASGGMCVPTSITNPDDDCANASDTSESSPQCSDGIDNDGDGTWDFGGANPDNGCTSAADNTERDFKFKEF